MVFTDLGGVSDVWAWLGKAVNRVFRTTVAMVRFQRLMALCLLVSAWAGMLA